MTCDGLAKLILLDIAPLSLGIEVVGDKMSIVIPRNTTIPTKTMKVYQTVYDNQSAITFPVYQEEYEYHFLGKFTLENIRKVARGDVKVEVTFLLDINSILKVSGVEVCGNRDKGEITIKCDNDRLSEDEIQRLIENAGKFRMKIKKLEIIEARTQLENYFYELKKKASNFDGDKKNKILRDVKMILVGLKVIKKLLLISINIGRGN